MKLYQYVSTLALAAFLLPMAVRAQDAAAQAPAAAPAASSDTTEVIVTAERRSTLSRKTAISVVALSPDDLDKKRVVSFADLQTVVPSLTISDAAVTKNINIRGIGLNVQSPVVTSGVALYHDGIFAPTTVFTSSPFYDLQGVEVLRGPQGTFVGQNSTGGAMFINSRSPKISDEGGNFSAQVGSYNDVDVRGALALPINDRMAARVAFNVEHRNPFFKNVATTSDPLAELSHPGGLDQQNLRLSFLWQPTDSFNAVLKVEGEHIDTGGQPLRAIRTTPFSAATPSDLDQVATDRANLAYTQQSARVLLDAKWHLTPDGLTLRSLSSYQTGNLFTRSDIDGSAADGVYQTLNEADPSTSEEITLISPDSGNFKWVVGAYFESNESKVGLVQTVDIFPFSPTAPQVVDVIGISKKQTTAAFAQGTLTLFPGLDVQVGVRSSKDEATNAGSTKIGPLVIPATGSYSEPQTTGKIALNWTVNPNHFVYLLAANGYKSGGINSNGVNFAAEKVEDYELGWKARLFDGHLRTDIGAFYMNYDNMQIQGINPVNTLRTVNSAGAAKISGFEGSAMWQFGAFHADLSLSHVDSSVSAADQIDARRLPGAGNIPLPPPCVPGQTVGCMAYTPFIVSVSGKSNPYSPEWSGNLSVSYDFTAGKGTLTPRINYSYAAEQWSTLFETPVVDYMAPRNLWSAVLTYETENYRVELYGSNLTNQKYVSGQAGSTELIGAPRQVGIKVERSF